MLDIASEEIVDRDDVELLPQCFLSEKKLQLIGCFCQSFETGQIKGDTVDGK